MLLRAPVTLQAKHYANQTEAIRLGVPEAVDQATRNGHQFGWAVIRRVGRPNPAEALVVMELWQGLHIVRELEKLHRDPITQGLLQWEEQQ